MGRGLSRSTYKRNADINLVYGCEIDPNCYVYRMIDGVKTLMEVRPGIPNLIGQEASRVWNQDFLGKEKRCAV